MFTKRYRIHRLVYYERFGEVRMAIEREKEIKGWRRSKKVALIENQNPTWSDLAEEWFSGHGENGEDGKKRKSRSLATLGMTIEGARAFLLMI